MKSLLLVRCSPLLLAAAALAASAADGPVEKVTVRAVARFGFDKARIAPADQARILAEVGQMKDVTWQTVTATGHTDSVGPVGYNERLSSVRADAVKQYLVGKGLSPEMITTAGKGPQAPVASNDTAAGRAENRRTEIEFQGVRAVAGQ
ncbi:MAG TPA: OmpA family protein [Ideonella sp.]|nr:OmpA family protein [Ideonella sp.]